MSLRDLRIVIQKVSPVKWDEPPNEAVYTHPVQTADRICESSRVQEYSITTLMQLQGPVCPPDSVLAQYTK